MQLVWAPLRPLKFSVGSRWPPPGSSWGNLSGRHAHPSKGAVGSKFYICRNIEHLGRKGIRYNADIFRRDNHRNARPAYAGSSVGNPSEQVTSASAQQYDRLLPDTPQGPSRVRHLLIESGGPASSVLAAALSVPQSYAADLVRFGAVYYCPIVPLPPGNAPAAVLLAFEARLRDSPFNQRLIAKQMLLDRGEALPVVCTRTHIQTAGTTGGEIPQGGEQSTAREGDGDRASSPCHVAPPSLDQVDDAPIPGCDVANVRSVKRKLSANPVDHHRQESQGGQQPRLEGKDSVRSLSRQEKEAKVARLRNQSQVLEAGGYVRVHVNPKRFPQCYKVDWRERVLADRDGFVVVDKPAGVPVGPTVDNLLENCAAFAAQALGLAESLRPTHMLDVCTQGCVVMARTQESASLFNKLLRQRRVEKLYRALTVGPVAKGTLVHYMLPGKYSPRILSPDERPGWMRCELEVLGCQAVAWPLASAASAHAVDLSGWPEQEAAYECTVRLVTGRTHQIRAQLSSVGAPLVGDTLYTPAAAARAAGRASLPPYCPPSLHSPSAGASEQPLEKGKQRNAGAGFDQSAEIPGIAHLEEGWERRSSCTSGDASDAMDAWKRAHGREPLGSIGLQAWQVQWDSEIGVVESRGPWWATTYEAVSS